MKKFIITLGMFSLVLLLGSWGSGCASSKLVAKSGAQLWGENCIRCHNAPSPIQFSDQEWSTIGTHMEITANLTSEESEKIVSFLRSAN